MYPFLRLLWQLSKHRGDAPLPPLGTHVSTHLCLPWDLDLWRELNNGRTLTLYDMGRIPLSVRTGLSGVLRERGLGMVVAGASVRYRRRITLMQRVTMKSRAVCWDARFVYIEQSLWRPDGECANHVLLRMAVIAAQGRRGIVPPAEVMAPLGAETSPPMPGWIAAWAEAEDKRPWPPMPD
ncbi:acyl-CoA thioesterase [Pseudoroseicyclus aestuarii]|uniref:Acyl-CoA thioesterase FadM n=1 Tax=Pseudoroseicyclus aestuarii TaxID=1795041 RepID=A0A318SVE8_9RHOB|nr:acyl-CoA thioesterase [Pseudoroseicyclus aestuarii]PYE84296.1 acyl-CoA thioesterase FadM [Pseudoroseicyclus aestuarii]